MERSCLWKRRFTILLLGLAIVGCAGVLPVQDVNNAPVVTGSGKPATPDGVQKAIMAAGVSLNMRMAVIRPGLVQATYSPRGDFTAIMEVSYDTKAYSIRYKSSDGLNYDPQARTIHKNYNSWVTNLQKRIDSQLSLL